MIHRKRLVPRAEIEHPPSAAVVTHSAAENLAAFKPADEHQFIGCGDAKRFAVHLLLWDSDIVVDAPGDLVAGRYIPQQFRFSVLPPFQPPGVGTTHLAKDL